MPGIRAGVKAVIKAMGYDITKWQEPIWATDAHFAELYEQIRPQTVLSKDRCFMLYQLTQFAAILMGDLAEVGVYRGGSAKLLAKSCINKTVHLFDTFTGLPKADPDLDQSDFYQTHSFSNTSSDMVQAFLADCDNVKIHKGLFPSTATPLESRKFCLVHIDTDLYQSVRDCFEFFYPRMVTGGVLVFDDYGWVMTPGVKQAIQEFLSGKPESPIISTRHQCFVIKR